MPKHVSPTPEENDLIALTPTPIVNEDGMCHDFAWRVPRLDLDVRDDMNMPSSGVLCPRGLGLKTDDPAPQIIYCVVVVGQALGRVGSLWVISCAVLDHGHPVVDIRRQQREPGIVVPLIQESCFAI